jgi:catechol 2,3-dioxygenase
MTQPTEVKRASESQPHLPNDDHIVGAHLRVIDLDDALAFYQGVLDFTIAERDGQNVSLAPSANEAPILRLTEHPDAVRKPQRSTGLYHIAILMPSRPALGQILRRMLTRRYPIGGASDHLVSEALYLSDPDGNGLEIYRDRPRSEWRMDGGQVAMATEALDVEGVLGEADEHSDAGIVPGTVMGHIHLHVGDLNRAEKFYGDLLGFDVMQRSYPGALFMAGGGYHHHLGLNTWAGKIPPPANAVGLESFTVTIPGEDAWQQAVERTGATVEGESASVRDPEGNTIILAKA